MVVGVIVGALAPAIIGTGLTASGGPLAPGGPGFPRISPGDILRTSLITQALSERGLVPVISTDPFTGNLAISTQDQSAGLFNLLGERFAREALASTPAESAEIFRQREALIESRRLNPFFPVVADPPAADLRQQVIAPLLRESPIPIAPGVVSSTRPAAATRRLGGPCAGVTTGFQRLNCARGGIS